LPDAVEDGATGLLVAPGDPAALAEALERIRRGFPFDPVRISDAVARADWAGFIAAMESLVATRPRPVDRTSGKS